MPVYTDKSLHNYLKELKVIPSAQLDQALALAKQQTKPLSDILISKDLITIKNLSQTLGNLTNTPYIYLSEASIDQKAASLIPEIVARKQKIIAFKINKQGLHLAMANPSNLQTIDFIGKKTGLPIITYITTKQDIQSALKLYTKDITEAFRAVITANVIKAKGSQSAEPPIIKIVETIISYAYQNKASDIHLEPLDDFSLVRFRIDGILHDIVKLPLTIHPQVITRIKVLAKLRTDEHQKAQDGKLVTKIEEENLDLRVSIVPITNGEKVVMRLLSEKSRQFSLEDLGFSATDLVKVTTAYKKPHGMILSTGPTGSGKTTSLYAILKLLNKREVNIATIEDPVEYDMDGINQIQVNEKTELTFSKGLRSIVRQDPDIILVGEIRDEETAGIAINSAMTGHLVLSTLHTNDAATSIPRLTDMNIEPFLISSTINIIIAQRLVRKICQNCRISYESPIKDLSKNLSDVSVAKHFKGKEKTRLYKGQGCPTCQHTGYTGRIGVFEVLEITDEIRQAIVDKQPANIIHDLAVKSGMTTMLDDGLEKTKKGLTTIEEVVRVTKE
jgi:type IV pilus assembly protein PilB